MTYAVIKSGGKQFLVTEGARVKMDKIEVEDGKPVTFDEVLLVNTDEKTTIGNPAVKGAKVEAKVLKQARHAKVTGVKLKAKKRYSRYFGHKQHYTEVEITTIKI